jgi:alkenylglycerophosphocholine/alkenylglycerophosphoethanolamine hydrolase
LTAAWRWLQLALSTPSWQFLGLAALLAAVDWVAVARGLKRLEYVFKPAVMLALIGVVLSMDGVLFSDRGPERAWFLVALTLGLIGDVCLMLPVDLFLWGLGAFLLGHLAYIAGFLSAGEDLRASGAAAVALVVTGVPVGRRVLASVRRTRPSLVAPVAIYSVALSVMVVAAAGSPGRWAVVGAALFYASDSMIGWHRFVRPRAWAPLTIAVTYHLGQALLVLSLLRPVHGEFLP